VVAVHKVGRVHDPRGAAAGLENGVLEWRDFGDIVGSFLHSQNEEPAVEQTRCCTRAVLSRSITLEHDEKHTCFSGNQSYVPLGAQCHGILGKAVQERPVQRGVQTFGHSTVTHSPF